MNTCNSPPSALFLYDALSEYRLIYRSPICMRLTNIFNICIHIAVAVYSNNVTFGNNVSTVFEMSAIHTVSFQPSLNSWCVSPQSFAAIKVMLCGLRYAFAILLIYH